MLDLSTCLKHYKRKDIQKELVSNADYRELGTRYLKGFFGKRPDMLQNEADILEFAKQGVSSFHISEEHWRNPLELSPSLKKKDLNAMRTGWDLIVDIDCPDWELSKKIAFVIIKILKKHGVSSISCKFSGNKGFHIGVPYKAFPSSVQGEETKLLFPDKVKRVMEYLAYCAKKEYSEEILSGLNLKQIASKIKVPESDLIHNICSHCGTIYQKKQKKVHYICEKCGTKTERDTPEDYISCSKCKSIVKSSPKTEEKCVKCKNPLLFRKEINLHLVLGLDQILISSRHLYRMAYSLHEKSGLVSIPINPYSVLAFDKKEAHPDNVSVKYSFLDDSKTIEGEAGDFILKALDFKPDIEEEVKGHVMNSDGNMRTSIDVDDIQEKIPLELFPPSILNILNGLKDGRKRALFVLVNFLTSVGWDYPDIEKLLEEWNKKNQEQLRERELKSQLNYHRLHKKKILPPNYSNRIYYADLGVLTHEEEVGRFKNPVNYAKARARNMDKGKKKKKVKDKDDNNKANKKQDKINEKDEEKNFEKEIKK